MSKAIIVLEDSGDGQIRQVLLYDPPLKDDVPLTPAQAVGGHCFGIVDREVKKLCAEVVDNVVPEYVDEATLSGIKSDGPMVMGAQPAAAQFQTPKVVRDLKGNV